MTRETAQKLLPIIQAFAEGKEIEFEKAPNEWIPAQAPSWHYGMNYRIKPREPREFWACWNKDADLDDPENELRLYGQKQINLTRGRQQIKLREILTDETQ